MDSFQGPAHRLDDESRDLRGTRNLEAAERGTGGTPNGVTETVKEKRYIASCMQYLAACLVLVCVAVFVLWTIIKAIEFVEANWDVPAFATARDVAFWAMFVFGGIIIVAGIFTALLRPEMPVDDPV